MLKATARTMPSCRSGRSRPGSPVAAAQIRAA
jgi:hypothetical protein